MTEFPLRDAETMAASQYFFPGLRSLPNGEPNASYDGFREVKEDRMSPGKGLVHRWYWDIHILQQTASNWQLKDGPPSAESNRLAEDIIFLNAVSSSAVNSIRTNKQ